MFRGYFDDSRTHGDERYAALSGFIGDAADWLAFDEPWREVLKDYGLSHFRTADWTNSKRQFKDWDPDRKEQCMNSLLKIILKRDLISVGVVIPLASYETFLSPAAKRWTSPHGFAAQCLFSAVAERFAPDDPDGKVAYMFESGSPGEGGVLNSYNAALKVPKLARQFHLAPISFGDKKCVPALQAADIAAYELCREGERKGTGKKIRYPLQRLRALRHDWFTPSEESFKTIVAGIEATGVKPTSPKSASFAG
jgi:hypothetical protein